MSRFKRSRPLRFKRGDSAICDVCGKQRPLNAFGDGTKIPNGTCIFCKGRSDMEIEQRKIELKRMSEKLKETQP